MDTFLKNFKIYITFNIPLFKPDVQLFVGKNSTILTTLIFSSIDRRCGGDVLACFFICSTSCELSSVKFARHIDVPY